MPHQINATDISSNRTEVKYYDKMYLVQVWLRGEAWGWDYDEICVGNITEAEFILLVSPY